LISPSKSNDREEVVLTEDAVMNALCDYLTADGWKIVLKATPDQRGTDVVATRAGVRMEVEAKGEGSSKTHTRRYGQQFNQA
jgi:HJR/Mrr/RecB family endonuclease